jgi:glycosyltransferase involved in cell wall biosynthesis
MSLSGYKIVHVTSVHRPLDVRIFEKQCKSLVACGAEVVLVAVHDRDEHRDGVAIRAIPRPTSRFQRMTWTAWRAFREALRQHADLIHVHDPELLPWANLMRLMGNVTVYDMHENVPKDILMKTWILKRVRRPIAWSVSLCERCLLARLPVIFAATPFRKDYPWVRRSVTVLNMPRLESIPAEASAPYEQPWIGYIGAVSRDRGSVVTLEALHQLRKRGIFVGWECVGPVSPDRHADELKQLVDQYQLSDIRFRGYLPSQQGWCLIGRCHVGLALMLPEPSYVESCPTKLFEYMAMGIPVVTSDFPLYREVVEKSSCGLCVDPSSPTAVADAIEFLLEDRQRAAEMGHNGRNAVLTRYNWTTEFQKLTGFYAELIGLR